MRLYTTRPHNYETIRPLNEENIRLHDRNATWPQDLRPKDYKSEDQKTKDQNSKDQMTVRPQYLKKLNTINNKIVALAQYFLV